MVTTPTSLKFAGYPLVNADPTKYPEAAGKANGYLCPLGAQPGIGYVLMLREHYNAISEVISQAKTLQFGSGGSSISIPGLYIVNAVKVSGGRANDLNAVYMLKLADKRWHARMSDIAIQVNVRCPAPPATSGASLYYEDSLDSGTPYTWARACEVCWNACPGFGAWPGMPVTPDGTPEGFQFIGVPAVDALETLLHKIGCELNYNPFTQAMSIVQMGQVQPGLAAALNANNSYLRDLEPMNSPTALVPATVRVYFHGRDKHYGTEAFTKRASGNWLTEQSWYKVDVASGLPGAVAGTVVSLWDDLPAIYNFDGSLDNSSDLNTRAAARAADFIADATVSATRQHTTYSGVVSNILPGSQINAVHWRSVDTRQGGEGLITVISNAPGIPSLGEHGKSGMEREGAGIAAAAGEALSTPDFQRHSQPLWPPLAQVVKVVGTANTIVAQAGSGLWSGKVMRIDSAATLSSGSPYVEAEDCWLAVLDPLTGSQTVYGSLFGGNVHLARLNGSADVSGTVRPLYLIDRVPNRLMRTTAGSTVPHGTNITVACPDGVNRITEAYGAIDSGDRLLTFFDFAGAVTPNWYSTAVSGGVDHEDIVRVIGANHDESNCLWVGEVVTPVDEVTGACSDPFEFAEACWLLVLDANGGSWDTSKMTLTVGDTFIGRRVFVGSGGWPVYAIRVGSPNGVELYNATLSAAMASTDATASVGDLTSWVDGSTVSGTSPSNTYGLAAKSSESIVVGKDNSSGSPVYKVLQLEHVAQLLLTGVLPDSATNTTKLQEKHRTCAVMSAEATESAATDWLTLVADTYVIDVLPDSGTATTALQKKTLDIRRFPTTNSDSAATAWLTLESQQIVTDVEDTGSTLTRDTLTIYVMPNTGTPAAGTVSNFTNCT